MRDSCTFRQDVRRVVHIAAAVRVICTRTRARETRGVHASVVVVRRAV